MPDTKLTATQWRLLRRFKLHPRKQSGYRDVCIHEEPRFGSVTFNVLYRHSLIKPQARSAGPSREVTWWEITQDGIEVLKKGEGK